MLENDSEDSDEVASHWHANWHATQCLKLVCISLHLLLVWVLIE